jgi:hypothetical protein
VIELNWHRWDPDGDGTITEKEFLAPRRGLRDFLVNNFDLIKSDSIRIRPEEIPVLDSNPRAWFEYWDYDQSGSLERDEVIRAIVRSFCLTTWGEPMIARAAEMRSVAMYMWQTMGYSDFDSITFEEFNKPYGLGDQVLHNLVHGQYFGEDEEMNVDDEDA